MSTASSLEAIKTLLAAHGAEQVRTSEDLRQRLVAIEWVRWVLVDGQRQPQPYRVSVAVQELRRDDVGWVADKDRRAAQEWRSAYRALHWWLKANFAGLLPAGKAEEDR